MNEHQAALLVATAQGVGPAAARKLLGAFGSYERAVAAIERRAARVDGVPAEAIRAIRHSASSGSFRREFEQVRAAGARFATPGDADYPAILGEIAHPPVGIFVLGRPLSALAPMVAIVGTRAPTPRGITIARDLAAGMATAGLTVVSGLARGIDTAAHEGALEARGPTVAVLGTGLGHVYPPENAGLAREIVRGGALVSEFPMRQTVQRGSFPRRNRIIAGLSAGVVVVEGGQRSGALITAARALEQGREVFAVPGPITEPQSRGPNGLIKDGATLVEGVDDVLAELADAWGPFGRWASSEDRTGSGTVARAPVDAAPGGEGVLSEGRSALAGRILAELSSTPISAGELAARIDAPPGELVSVLFELELSGAVCSCPGGRYVAAERPRGVRTGDERRP